MIADALLLLNLSLQISWNGFLARSLVQKIGVVAATLVIGSLVTIAASGVGFGLGALLNRFPELGLEPLFPGVILTLTMLILLIGSFAVTLSSLYLSSDIETLVTAPVDRRAVFISKIIGNLGLNYAILLATAIPALLAFGAARGYGPGYYLFGAVAVLAAPLLPEAIGALGVMVIARVAPVRRIREVLAIFGAFVGLSFAVLANSSRFWLPSIAQGAAADLEELAPQLRAIAELPIPPLLAGRGLVAIGNGDVGGLVPLALYFLLTVGVFLLVAGFADRLYFAGWLRMQGNASGRRNAARSAREATNRGLLGRAGATTAIALKDWRIVPRDLRQFAQLLGPLAILPLIYLNVFSTPGGNRGAGLGGAISGLGGVVGDPSNVFVAMGILLGTALVFGQAAITGISMEGRAWWILKTAPLSAWDIIRGKFLGAFGPFFVLSTVVFVAVGIWRGFSPLGFVWGYFGIQLLGFGIIALAVGLGIPWAKLDWTNPKDMSRSWGVLWWFIGYAIYGLLGGVILCLPLVVENLAPGLTVVAYIGAALAAFAVTAGMVWTSWAIGAARIYRIGEPR